MVRIHENDLRSLCQVESKGCVSVYLPTHVAGDERVQDTIRLKNLLDEAEQSLVEAGWRAPEARDLVEPARQLAQDDNFWSRREQGLAIFVAPDYLKSFVVDEPFKELMVVGRQFHVKPMLPWLRANQGGYMLLLSENQTRLVHLDRQGVSEVEVAALPKRMDEALNLSGADRGEQVHSAMRGDQGKEGAVFHGQGGEKDRHKDDLLAYHRLVDEAVEAALHGQTEPLVLAGGPYAVASYREVSTYPRVLEDEAQGNFDYASDEQIHEAGWPLVERSYQREPREVAEQFAQWNGTGRAADDLSQVLRAGLAGNLDAVMVDVDAWMWGSFDEATGDIELHESPQPGDEDLLDRVVRQTFACDGRLFATERVEMPTDEPIAAVFRYVP